MVEIFLYGSLIVLGAFIASIAQLILKTAANSPKSGKIRQYFDTRVLISYAMIFGCTFLNIIALKKIPLSMSPILEASGYIFVALLSYLILKEKLTKRQIFGITLIVVGIVVFSLELV